MSALPTVARIVLVRSPKFHAEFPAIVVRTYAGVSEDHVDVQVFTDEDCGTMFLSAIGPQSESAKGWGWRWPPREERQSSPAPFPDPRPASPASALSQEEPLARV